MLCQVLTARCEDKLATVLEDLDADVTPREETLTVSASESKRVHMFEDLISPEEPSMSYIGKRLYL